MSPGIYFGNLAEASDSLLNLKQLAEKNKYIKASQLLFCSLKKDVTSIPLQTLFYQVI